jgi:hypothetical protein
MKTSSPKPQPLWWVAPLLAMMILGGCTGSDAGVYEIQAPPDDPASIPPTP